MTEMPRQKSMGPKVGTTETKEEQLKRLAGRRVSLLLKSFRAVGTLAALKPTPEQANRIHDAINKAHAELKVKLATGSASANTFDLGG